MKQRFFSTKCGPDRENPEPDPADLGRWFSYDGETVAVFGDASGPVPRGSNDCGQTFYWAAFVPDVGWLYLHRVALALETGRWPPVVSFRNGNGADLRRGNLVRRELTVRERTAAYYAGAGSVADLGRFVSGPVYGARFSGRSGKRAFRDFGRFCDAVQFLRRLESERAAQTGKPARLLRLFTA